MQKQANKLKDKTSKFPQTSGVYFMKDTDNKVIYIGKASNLRSRLKSYFQTFLTTKTQAMMQEVVNITYQKTDSDLDALLLEARLVRDLHPKYNLRLTDDKTFPLLAVTEEEFPRVFITRERGKKDITYYGPFISNTDLRNALRTLQRIFRFRTCKYKISSVSVTPDIPDGTSNYEESRRGTKCRDGCLLSHINLCSSPCLGKINRLDYRETINSLKDFLNGDKVSLKSKLEQLMKQASRKLDYENAAIYRNQFNALKNISDVGKLGPFYEESLLTETPAEKMRLLKEIPGLPDNLSHIEGIDISDIKGRQATGSVVVFIDGEPAKNLYRRFKIEQTPEGMADDYSRIREIVYRRFSRLIRTDIKVDLLLIDGGKGHINVSSKVFDDLKIKPPVIVGLAKGVKRETVYIMRESKISKLKMNNKLRLLAYIRDEAHRFARKYHHLRRSKEL